MENFKWFEKWYSKHVVDNHKSKVSVNIESLPDYTWKIRIEFDDSAYKHMEILHENKKISNFNHYTVTAQKGLFEALGDFTKLDLLFGKFRVYLGSFETHYYEKDYFLMPDIQDFIFKGQEGDYIFLHYTSEDSIAQSIIETGFRFTTYDKTTVKTQNKLIDLNYNHLVRKPFGKSVVVICISKKLYNKYLNLLNQSKNKYLKVEEILTESKVQKNESDEDVHLLHHKFIRGWFNYQSRVIVDNPEFDSNFDSDLFMKNINN